MAVLQYKKKEGRKLSDHFTSSEFDCPCSSCGSTLVDSELVNRLEAMRKAIGDSIRVNSGYRCRNYQLELAARGYETASGVSQHELGKAADIMSEPRTGAELEKTARSVGFKAVGVGHSFIHVDMRNDKERRWFYVKR